MSHRQSEKDRRSSGPARDLAVSTAGMWGKTGDRSSRTAVLAEKQAAASVSIGPAWQKLSPGRLAGCIRDGQKTVRIFKD